MVIKLEKSITIRRYLYFKEPLFERVFHVKRNVSVKRSTTVYMESLTEIKNAQKFLCLQKLWVPYSELMNKMDTYLHLDVPFHDQ